MTTIRVLSRDTAQLEGYDPPMVPDLARRERGIFAYVGWKHDPTLGEEFDHYEDDPKTGQLVVTRRRQGGFVHVPTPVELKFTEPEHAKFYRDALVAGDLLPADQATATWAGVPFKPAAPKASAGTKQSAAPAPAGDTQKGG